ncbi:tryptophanase [Colletotrichum plurivorum]|uniref:Tryptophanase n=1 Tax=Colletotrichum plurivorum TaxID=2175906 RepID=A0A8H6JJV8_9PEZI|nr:tryptophanase [Colletotrichum plurivorum]
MTDVQCAAILFGDESYGRNWGHYCLLEAFRDLFERGNDRQYTFPNALASMADSAFYRSMFFEEVSGLWAEALLFSTKRDTMKAASSSGGAAEGPPALISNGFCRNIPSCRVPGPRAGGNARKEENLDVEKTVSFLFELSNARRVSMLLLTSPITGRLPARLNGQHRRAFPANFGANVGIRLTERQIMCYGNNSYGDAADHMASSPRLASLLSFLNTTASGPAKLGLLVGKKGAIAQNRDSISNLVRFAVPRYVMSDRHIEYTVAIISELHARRHTIPGVRVTRGKEMRMHIFQSRVGPVPVASPEADSTQERTLNLCPFEYSIAVEQKTGKAQSRLLIEAQ